MSLALCHGLSKSYELVEYKGNEGMVLIHQVMGRNRASDTFKRGKKHPKINLKKIAQAYPKSHKTNK